MNVFIVRKEIMTVFQEDECARSRPSAAFPLIIISGPRPGPGQLDAGLTNWRTQLPSSVMIASSLGPMRSFRFPTDSSALSRHVSSNSPVLLCVVEGYPFCGFKSKRK